MQTERISLKDKIRSEINSMFFWGIEELKTKLIERPFSDREVFPYFLTILGMWSLSSCFKDTTANTWDIAINIWGVFSTVVGILYIYRQNGGSNGQQFLQRSITISFVAGIRLAVFLAVPVFVLAQFRSNYDTQWYDFPFVVIVDVIFFWRIGVHIRDVAKNSRVLIA